MNKNLALLLAPALLISTTSMASDLQISIGGKAWLNTWEGSDNEGYSFDTNAVMMVGPSVTLRSGGFFAGGSYMFSLNDYEYEYEYSDGYEDDSTFSADKNELNLIAGFMFTPRIGIYGGYKLMNSSGEYSGTDFNSGSNSNIEWSGLGFGVTGNFPINDKVVLFGSFGIQSLEEEWSWNDSDGYSDTDTDDLDGTVFEFGASMALSSSMSASMSYKQQNYKYDTGSETDMNLSGLAASINIAL